MELIRSNSTKEEDVVKGLFRGIQERIVSGRNVALVLIGFSDEREKIHAYNTSFYKVLSISMGFDDKEDSKEMMIYKHHSQDQEKAMLFLESTLSRFRESSMMVSGDPEIIDSSKYKNFPENEYKAPEDIKSKKPAASTSSVNESNRTVGGWPNYQGACGYNNSSWKEHQKKREEERRKHEAMRKTPTAIKRVTVLPSKELLDDMEKRIKQIAAGEVVIDINKEDEVEVDASNSTVICASCAYYESDHSATICSICEGNDQYLKWTT
jgi:hypothetical protein